MGITTPNGSSDTQLMWSTWKEGLVSVMCALEFHFFEAPLKWKVKFDCLFFFPTFKVLVVLTWDIHLSPHCREDCWEKWYFQSRLGHELTMAGPFSEPHSPQQPSKNRAPLPTPPPRISRCENQMWSCVHTSPKHCENVKRYLSDDAGWTIWYAVIFSWMNSHGGVTLPRSCFALHSLPSPLTFKWRFTKNLFCSWFSAVSSLKDLKRECCLLRS